MGLWGEAVFKAEKVKKNLLIIYAPLEGFLRGFDQAFFEENFWEILDGRSEKKFIDNITP